MTCTSASAARRGPVGLAASCVLIWALGCALLGPVRSDELDAAAEPQLPRVFSFSLPLFATGSAWNQSAAGAEVWPDSDAQLLVLYRVLRGHYGDLVGYTGPATTWPFIDISYDEYSIPIFHAGEGQQSVWLCNYDGELEWPHPKFGGGQAGGPVTVPAPAGTVRPSGPQDTDADGHLVLYNPATSMAYDFWQATTQRDGQCQSWGGGYTGSQILEAGVIDFFDVRGPGANPDGYYSARAHGTPLLAGMLLPEDVESGAISHALAFSIPGPRNLSPDPSEPLPTEYFYPASTTETDFYSRHPQALAAGQRIRLMHALVDEEGEVVDVDMLAPITRMFLAALRNYGAYLADNAAGFTFYAEDYHTANLHLTDAEVNALIGQPATTPLPSDKTKWQLVIDQLALDLELVPFAYDASWQAGDDPATAVYDTANWQVVEPAAPPASAPPVYIPFVVRRGTG